MRPSSGVFQAEGSFLIPGLWDAHAHLDMEAARSARIDTLSTRSAEEALELVAQALRDHPAGSRPATIQGFGHRPSNWPRVPTVAELDAVTEEVPTLLISGDVHSGWLNSAALRVFGLPGASAQDPGAPMKEDPWFALLDRLDEVPGTRELRESGYRQVLADMLSRGITGVVDMSWSEDPDDWPRRLRAMADQGVLPEVLPRIRIGVYRDKLERWIADGLRTGTALAGSPRLPDGSPVLVQGPLKVIADGSMGSGSAWRGRTLSCASVERTWIVWRTSAASRSRKSSIVASDACIRKSLYSRRIVSPIRFCSRLLAGIAVM